MLPGKIRGWLGLMIFIFSLLILIWGIFPYQKEVREIHLSPADLQPQVSYKPDNFNLPSGFLSKFYNGRSRYPPLFLSLTIPENRLLTLIFPQKMKVGDSDIIQLTLELDSQETGELMEFPTLAKDNNKYYQDGNLFDLYHVIVEARLEMAGTEYLPTGDISEALLPAIPVAFLWNIRSSQAGFYQGTVWLHLVFISKAGGQDIRQVLTAQRMNIEVVNFFGLNGKSARILGVIGVILGLTIGLEYFLEMIRKIAFGDEKT
jgi:hypothetical protein